jgi:hypothetical protein
MRNATLAALAALPLGACIGPAPPLETPAFLPRGAAEACAGPGRPVGLSNYTWQDRTRPLLLPPGCATSAAIAAQVEDPDDLVRGRPLPPGSALPFAQAVERYYGRNENRETRPAGGEAAPAVELPRADPGAPATPGEAR